MITENAKIVRGVALDRLVETTPRGAKVTFWRRADRREHAGRIVSTWDHTQRAALAR